MKYQAIPEQTTDSAPHVESDQNEDVNEGNIEEYELLQWCGFRRSNVLLIFYVVTYFAYLILGGFIMSVLETPNQESLKTQTKSLKEEFLKNNPLINKTEFEQMLRFIVESNKHGVGLLDSNLEEDNWSIGQSLLFTVTVVTTVGYGHVVPLTPNGKIFCILYATLGIPFTLVFLSATVQRLLGPTFKILAWMMSGKLGNAMSPLGVRVIHLLFMCTAFGIFVVVIPSIIFSQIESSWALLDAFYFVFISLTTIGLGDFVPGDSDGQVLKDLYKSLVAGYLLFGIVFMSLTLTVFYDIPQLNLGMRLHTYSDIKYHNSGGTGKNVETIHLMSTAPKNVIHADIIGGK